MKSGTLIHRLPVAEMCSNLIRMYVQRAPDTECGIPVVYFFREGGAWLIGEVGKFFSE